MECLEEGCTKPVHSRGLCQAHYRYEMRRAKDPEIGTRKPGPQPDPSKPRSRHRERAARGSSTEEHCAHGHPWDEHTTAETESGRKYCRYCSYISTALRHGRIPKGLGEWIEWRKDRDLFCANGHPWTEESTVRHSTTGFRACRICRKNADIRNKYGLEPFDFMTLMERQSGKCAICKADFDDVSPHSIHIDHDHSCCPGKSCGECVRGILCDRCNVGLGNFKDNPVLLEAAIVYLGLTTRGDQLTLVVSP